MFFVVYRKHFSGFSDHQAASWQSCSPRFNDSIPQCTAFFVAHRFDTGESVSEINRQNSGRGMFSDSLLNHFIFQNGVLEFPQPERVLNRIEHCATDAQKNKRLKQKSDVVDQLLFSTPNNSG
jgi:hypothetical protein